MTSSPYFTQNGKWNFALDPGDVGYKAKWYGPAGGPALNESITVPGISVGATGFGNASTLQHHWYTGVSWFSRTAELPTAWIAELAGGGASTLLLSVGGVKSSALFWINGIAIGKTNTAPFASLHPLSLSLCSYNAPFASPPQSPSDMLTCTRAMLALTMRLVVKVIILGLWTGSSLTRPTCSRVCSNRHSQRCQQKGRGQHIRWSQSLLASTARALMQS